MSELFDERAVEAATRTIFPMRMQSENAQTRYKLTMAVEGALKAATEALDPAPLIERVAGVVLGVVPLMAGWQARNVARAILRDLGLINRDDT